MRESCFVVRAQHAKTRRYNHPVRHEIRVNTGYSDFAGSKGYTIYRDIGFRPLTSL